MKRRDTVTNIPATSGRRTPITKHHGRPSTLPYPSAPRSLAGTAGDTSVSLTWLAPTSGAPITGYYVYQDGVFVSATSGLAATITGLTNDQSYGFKVSAHNATGEGPKTSALTLVPVGVDPDPDPDPDPTPSDVPYDAASPWNTPIGVAVVDPDSATWMAAIVDNALELTCDPDQFTIPVYAFDADTPLATILINGFYSTYDAGDDSRVGHGTGSTQSIPIPAGIVPPDGSDGQVELLDPVAGIQYGFWQLVDEGGGSWSCENAYRYHTTTGYMGRFADGLAGRGAGTPYLAGLVRRWEVDQGHIDHALAFAYDSPSGEYVYPASKSDGGGFGGETGTDAPEGARLQLDPALDDVDFTGWGLSDMAKIIAVALQTYGAYVIDHSGSSKLYLESRLTADWDVSIDRDLVSGIPWSAFRFVVGPEA